MSDDLLGRIDELIRLGFALMLAGAACLVVALNTEGWPQWLGGPGALLLLGGGVTLAFALDDRRTG